MRISSWFAVPALGWALAVSSAPAAVAADDGAARAAAVTAARPVIAAARKAAQGGKETYKALKEARAAMEPFASAVRAGHWDESKGTKDAAFAVAWNELITVCEYHGVVGKPEYVLGRNEILWKRYQLGLPNGSAWSWKYNPDTKDNDQLHMFVNQVRPNGQKLRQIKVWTYRWDTVYSGVGGENYKGLAKMMHEVDRDITAKSGRKSSTAVNAKRLNAEFDRVYYYFVEGLDVGEEKRLHRDNYYMKGLNVSFNFEVITYMDPTEGDDGVTKWQCGENDPEIAAVLGSLVSNPNYTPPK